MECKIKGFTLIEVIISLVLLAVVSVGLFQLLANTIAGFSFAKNSDATTEKVQLAFMRMAHEIANINTAKSYSVASNIITYYYSTASASTTIRLTTGNLQLDGNTLLDNVSSFTAILNSSPSITITVVVNITNASTTVQKTYTTTIDLNTNAWS
jgi:prepilin-type N-terminal cleavage/methylation domain-containing protein